MRSAVWLHFRQRWAARLLRPFLWLELITRWLVYLAAASLSLFSLFALLVFLWLFVSEPGGGWLVRQAPGVSVEGFSGHLLNAWQAEELSWQGESVRVQLTDLDVRWQPWCLLRLNLCLQQVVASELEVKTQPSDQPQDQAALVEDSGWDAFRMPEITLPELQLPTPLAVDDLQLGRFLVNGESHFYDLHLEQGRWQSTEVTWVALELKSRWLPLDAGQPLQLQGQLAMQGDWPLQADLQARWQGLQLAAEVGGSLNHLELISLHAQGLPLQARGELALFTPELPMQLELEAAGLPLDRYWQLQQQPLPAGLNGWSHAAFIDSAQLNLAGDLKRGWSLTTWAELLLDEQSFALDLEAQFEWETLSLQKLQLTQEQDQQLSLAAQVDWEGLEQSFTQGWDAMTAHAQLEIDQFFSSGFPWSLWLPELSTQPWQSDQLRLFADLQQGQLALDAELATDWAHQQDHLQLATELSLQLALASLWEARPDFSVEKFLSGEQDLAWTQAIELEAVSQLQGRFQSYAVDLEMDLTWQGEEQRYQLLFPNLSLQGTTDEYLAARIEMTSDRWQAEISSYWPDLAQLTGSWMDDLEGDLAMSAQAELPAPQASLLVERSFDKWLSWLGVGDYQLRASSQALYWQTTGLNEGALTTSYSGYDGKRLWGEQPIQFSFLADHLQVDESSSLEELKLDLSGLLREHQILMQAVFADQPLEAHWVGGWQHRPLQQKPLRYQLLPFASEQLASFLPDNLRWQDALEGSLHLGWQEGILALGQLNAEGGRLGIYQTDEVNQVSEWVEFPYQTLAAEFALEPDRLVILGQLAGEQLGESELGLELSLRPDPKQGERSLAGHYRLQDTDLQLLLPFLDVDEIGGHLQGEGVLRGHLQAPEVWGNLVLQEARAANVRWPTSLTRLDAEVTLKARQASIEGDFLAGRRGEGQLQGQLNWHNGLEGELTTRGQRIDVRIEPWASLELHPDLLVTFNNGEVHLGGRLEIPSGDIQVQRLPQQAVRVSSDARVKNRPEPEPTLIRSFNMDIELLVGQDQLALNAFGLEADLEGRLRLGDNLDARGELLLVRGVYESFGQDLRLRRARLTFSGPVDLPFLDVEAVRDIAPGIVGIRMTGRIDQPETEIFSEPAMSNEQALSWLLTGAPLEAGTDMNALALSMGLAGLSSYTTAVGEAIGVREFELSTEGEGDQASLVAAGYLNRRLSVRYGVGIYEDISRVAIRYQLTRQLYVEVVSSIENSLDIFWEVDY